MPDVSVHDIVPGHEFIVLACDGIWDVMSNQEVVDFVRVRIAQHMEPDIVSVLYTYCVISIVISTLLHMYKSC